MSKIICEICGTVYPDNATMCPICGYPRNLGDSPDPTQTETAAPASRNTERVKGGKYSNNNVKKRNQPAASAAPASKARRAAQEDRDEPKTKKKKKKNNNRGLVVTVLILLVAVILVGAYIGFRFFRGADAYKETSEPTNPPTESSETVPEDTAAACTDFEISDIDLTEGIEFLGMGRAWRVKLVPVPENTTDEFTFTSSDEDVAVINQTEDWVEILSVGPGSATITITCGSVSKSFPVECNFDLETEETTDETTEDNREEGELSLSSSDISFFGEGESCILDPGKGIDAADVEWTSADEDVATVKDGKIVAVGEGTTEITASYNGEKATCVVRCNFEDDSQDQEDAGGPYTISHTDVSIVVDESFELTLKDSAGNVLNVTWKGDEDVKIEGNTITGVDYGTTYVTCTYKGETYECIVRIV